MENREYMKNCSIVMEGKEINYILTKSNRKTIGISISIKDGLKVAAPKRAHQKQIEEIILKNAPWIVEKLQVLTEYPSLNLEFKEGGTFSYLGKEYTLRVIKPLEKKIGSVELVGDCLNIYLQQDGSEEIKHALVLWYRREALRILGERTKCLVEGTGLVPLEVKIKEQKSRFGSCSSKKNINLNWKLIMAPVEVIDYVILHELCHLQEMNHSSRFWNLVESHMADYKIRRQWLKEKGNYIRLW